jgi:aminopeptidase N
VRPGTLGTVRQLREHEAFTLLNPNRFRALVSGFAQNLSAFHDASGGGYEFLADRIIELDPINPQVAARVCAPLTRWRRIAGSRQTLMKAQLNRILESEGLSRDVYEIVSKSA